MRCRICSYRDGRDKTELSVSGGGKFTMDANKKQCTAIVLAAGSGKRMESATSKQFLMLGDRPVIWYPLQTIEQSGIIDRCILVTGAEDIDYVRREIVGKYHFLKVSAVVAGGRERWESVYRGLCRIAEEDMPEGYVFIHDGARPFLSEKILEDLYHEVCRSRACIAAVPAKDTVKIADQDGFIRQTPDRRKVWTVQTPQAFEKDLIIKAYQMFYEGVLSGGTECSVTDDAMVVEKMLGVPVKTVVASYENIKITTPEDMDLAEALLVRKRKIK